MQRRPFLRILGGAAASRGGTGGGMGGLGSMLDSILTGGEPAPQPEIRGPPMAEHITIGDVAPRVQYVADGVLTAFTYPFPIFEEGDLEIRLDGAVQIGNKKQIGAARADLWVARLQRYDLGA